MLTASYYKELEQFLITNYEVDLSTVISILPRNYQLTNTALELFTNEGSSLYIDFDTAEDRLAFFTCIQHTVSPSLLKYNSYFRNNIEIQSLRD